MDAPPLPVAPAEQDGFRCFAADAYLFDIDGTLLNCRGGAHYQAFHNALRAVFGVDSSIDGVPLHGNTDIGILRAVLRREGVTDPEIDARLPLMLEQMCAEVESKAEELLPELCPSVELLLDHLRRRGKLLGVVSGNFERVGWQKLQAAGLRGYFAFGAFSDRNEKREDIFRAGLAEVRRRLSPAAVTYVVGDTPADILAARAVGLPIIAVATGIYALDQLQEHRPDASYPCCTDLLAPAGSLPLAVEPD